MEELALTSVLRLGGAFAQNGPNPVPGAFVTDNPGRSIIDKLLTLLARLIGVLIQLTFPALPDESAIINVDGVGCEQCAGLFIQQHVRWAGHMLFAPRE